MEHSHDHNHHGHHHHGHSHAPVNYSRAFAIGAAVNLLFVVVEASYGYWSNSLALVADAGHNFSDVVGLLLAWAAAWLSTRKPSARFTYGFGKTSIFAAVINAILLVFAITVIIWEAVVRLQNPQSLSTQTVIIIAAIGIVVNGATALLFMSGRKEDLNARGAYAHLAADALISLGVVVTGLVISFTGWMWLDPLVSIAIGVLILIGTWGLLRDSVNMAIAAVPSGVDIDKVKKFLSEVQGVQSVHDLHVWAMSTTETALTAHIVMPSGHPGDAFLKKISHDLDHHHRIHHATLQIEIGDEGGECHLKPDDVV